MIINHYGYAHIRNLIDVLSFIALDNEAVIVFKIIEQHKQNLHFGLT